jgi:hypothetical protein
MRIRVEGTFVVALGYVTEGVIELDFSPLGSDTKTTIRFTINRD